MTHLSPGKQLGQAAFNSTFNKLAACIFLAASCLFLANAAQAESLDPLQPVQFGFTSRDSLMDCSPTDRVSLDSTGPQEGVLSMRWDVRPLGNEPHSCRHRFNQHKFADAERVRFFVKSATSGKLIVKLTEEDGETFYGGFLTGPDWSPVSIHLSDFRVDPSTKQDGELDIKKLARFELLDARSLSGRPTQAQTYWIAEWFFDVWPNPVVRTRDLPYAQRPYDLGFVQWPPAGFPDPGPAATRALDQFANEHADLTLCHIEGGVPWVEALENKPFSDNLSNYLSQAAARIPQNHRVLVSITPLDSSRSRMAPYWGQSQGMPLPEPWNSYPLNHINVKIAYLNYTRRIIEQFKPDYLVIGIEANLLLTGNGPSAGNLEAWKQYLELHKFVYTALKYSYPKLPISASVLIAPLRATDGTPVGQFLQGETAKLLASCDFLGISAHPFGESPPPVPENYFDVAVRFGKPIGITETSFPSRSFEVFGRSWHFTRLDQYQYVDLLLRKANDNRFAFIAYVPPRDFDIWLPQLRWDLGIFWAYNGLWKSDGELKPSLDVWDAYRQLPKY